jgi:hypothetical protein
VEKARDSDYSVTFADCQRLQKVRKKLIQVRDILTNNIRIVNAIQHRFQSLAKVTGRSKLRYQCVCDALSLQNESLRSHELAVKSSIEYSGWVARMVSRVVHWKDSRPSVKISHSLLA